LENLESRKNDTSVSVVNTSVYARDCVRYCCGKAESR
jgi:hypothetical protein